MTPVKPIMVAGEVTVVSGSHEGEGRLTHEHVCKPAKLEVSCASQDTDFARSSFVWPSGGARHKGRGDTASNDQSRASAGEGRVLTTQPAGSGALCSLVAASVAHQNLQPASTRPWQHSQRSKSAVDLRSKKRQAIHKQDKRAHHHHGLVQRSLDEQVEGAHHHHGLVQRSLDEQVEGAHHHHGLVQRSLDSFILGGDGSSGVLLAKASRYDGDVTRATGVLTLGRRPQHVAHATTLPASVSCHERLGESSLRMCR